MNGVMKDSQLDEWLRRLSVHDMEAGKAEEIQRLAHAILDWQQERAARWATFDKACWRFLEPVFASAVVVLYLTWALERALFLLQLIP